MARRGNGMTVSADISGLRELYQNNKLLLKKTSVQDKDFQGAIMSVGNDIRDKMKQKVPVEDDGHWYLPSEKGKTADLSKLRWISAGALKRSLRAQRYSNPRTSAGFVATHFKQAPHAHLVEYGTGTRWATKPSGLIKPYPHGHREEGAFFGMSTDPIPEKPYFRPVVDEYSANAKFAIEVNKRWTRTFNRIRWKRPRMMRRRRFTTHL